MNNFDYKQVLYYAPPVIILLVIFGYYWSLRDLPTIKVGNLGTSKQTIKTESQAAIDAFNNNDFVTANKLADEMLSRNTEDVKALILKANTLAQEASLTFKEKDLGDQSRDLALQAIKLEPNNLEALTLIGYTYEIQEDYKNAHKYYDTVLKIDPTYEKALDQKGHAFDLQGDLVAAEKYYIAALEANPDYPKTLSNLARIYILTNKPVEAKKLLERKLPLTNNLREKAEIFYALGTLKEDIRKYSPEATVLYKQAIETDPTFALAYVGLAKEEFKNYQLEESFGHLAKALEINPNQSNAAFQLAFQYHVMDQSEVAIQILEKLKLNLDKDISINKNTKLVMQEAIKSALATFKE